LKKERQGKRVSQAYAGEKEKKKASHFQGGRSSRDGCPAWWSPILKEWIEGDIETGWRGKEGPLPQYDAAHLEKIGGKGGGTFRGKRRKKNLKRRKKKRAEGPHLPFAGNGTSGRIGGKGMTLQEEQRGRKSAGLLPRTKGEGIVYSQEGERKTKKQNQALCENSLVASVGT